MAGRKVAKFLQRRGGLAVVVLLCAIVGGSIAATCVRGGPAGVGTSTPPTEITPGPTETPAATTISTPAETPATVTEPSATPKLKPTWTPNLTVPDCLTPHPLQPIGTQSLPDGGTAYVYDTNGDGVGDTRYNVPPPGFDVATASESELQIYGLPPRPTDPSELATWIAVWGGPGEWPHDANSSICESSR